VALWPGNSVAYYNIYYATVDRTEICIGTDIAILAFSSGILKYYAPFFLNLQPIFTKIGAVTDPYSCRLNRTK
jgi:hypothetical protein